VALARGWISGIADAKVLWSYSGGKCYW